MVPTLKAFSLRAYDPKEVIIAGGDQEAVVLSPSGAILAIIELPAPPTHALILEDFSGDGLTDMVVDIRRRAIVAYPELSHFIDARWIGADAAASSDVIDPTTEAVLGRVPHADEAQ